MLSKNRPVKQKPEPELGHFHSTNAVTGFQYACGLNIVLPCVDGCAAPEITEGPVDVTEFVDNRLMMACSARGDPRPSIQWQKRNGTGGRWLQVSRASERYKVQRNGNLVIRRLLASDAGLFRCVAENTVGSAYSAAATLVVQGLPYYPFETFHYFKSGLPRILEST